MAVDTNDDDEEEEEEEEDDQDEEMEEPADEVCGDGEVSLTPTSIATTTQKNLKESTPQTDSASSTGAYGPQRRRRRRRRRRRSQPRHGRRRRSGDCGVLGGPWTGSWLWWFFSPFVIRCPPPLLSKVMIVFFLPTRFFCLVD